MARIPSGASLRYPPGWRPARSDLGTTTAVLPGMGRHYRGYLNLTPQQGTETLANWVHFRIEHNLDEDDRTDHRLASATDLAFPTGRGSCVTDSYTTRFSTRYIELACLIAGSRSTVVVVGAAPPGEWPQERAEIARAVLGVRA